MTCTQLTPPGHIALSSIACSLHTLPVACVPHVAAAVYVANLNLYVVPSISESCYQ